MIGSWDRSMGGGANNASRLAQYCADKSFCNSFQSFNTCYKVSKNKISKLQILLSNKKCGVTNSFEIFI